MAKNFLVDIDLNKNQLLNAKLQNLATAPTLQLADKGFAYWNTTDNKPYFWTGTVWTTTGSGVTDLSHTKTVNDITITSSTGTSTTIPAADTVNAGVMTAAMYTKLAGITAGADVTNSTTVSAAGAVMKSSYEGNSILAANNPASPSFVILSTNTILGRISGNIQAITIDSDLSTVSANDDTIASAKATKAYTDAQIAANKHYQLYKPDGTTPFVYTDAAGKLHIDGDIVQSGTSYITHSENLNTTKDIITLRDGAVAGLGAGVYTGIVAKLYDGVNDGRLVFDNSGFLKVGDVGSEQTIATRIDSPTNGYIAYWEGGNYRLNFKQLGTSDITNLSSYVATTATALATARNITLSGDISGTAFFNGSADAAITATLPNIATAGTYKSVTVNTKGLVTAGSNPTTLSGYGITDATKKYAVDITGNGSATSFTVTHNLNTVDIVTFIKETTTTLKVEAEEAVTNVNVLTLTFNTAPANGKVYRVTVIG